MFKKTFSLVQWLSGKLAVAEPEFAAADLQRWFETPFGQYLIARQRYLCSTALPSMGGFRTMELGLSPDHGLLGNFNQLHRFYVGSAAGEEKNAVTAISDFTALPLPSDTVDVAIMHHTLDFSPNPHAVLSEAARVIVPGGHIILVGFNPFSLFGLKKWPALLLSQRAIWRRQNLRMGRVVDWLRLLGCQPVCRLRGCFQIPWQSRRALEKLSFLENWGDASHLPTGAFYIVVARKQVVSPIPLKTQRWIPQSVTPLGIQRQLRPSVQINKKNEGYFIETGRNIY